MIRSLVIILLACSFSLLFSQEGEYKKYYYPNGTLSSEGLMVNGKPEGIWKSYHPNGVLKSTGKRTNHLLDSIWTFYNERGDIVKSINYNLGKKNGYLTTYYVEPKQPINKGKIKSKELYVHDKKNGMSLHYREDGSLEEEIYYVNNQRDGFSYEYNEQGLMLTIKRYKNDMLIEREKINRRVDGLKSGIWMEFYDDGKMKQSVEFKNGERDGYSKFYDRKGDVIEVVLYRNDRIVENEENDNLNIVEKKYQVDDKLVIGSFKEDIKIGIHRVYENDSLINSFIYNTKGELLEEGKIKEDGSRTGNWKIFYENGSLYASGKYKNSQKYGKWNYYYESGRLLQTGSYRNGKPDGEWIWFYNDGDTLRYEEFISGKENGYYIEYNNNGNIVAEGYYVDGEKDGEWYYHVGDIKEKGSYVFGLKNGEWTQHYDNDNLRYIGNYIQGNADGKHKFYYPDGTIKEEQYYISGYKEGNWKKYDRNGNIMLVITYENNEETRINGQKIELSENKVLIK